MNVDHLSFEECLSKITCSKSGNAGVLSIISRETFKRASTFPVQILRGKLGNGDLITFFCKYFNGICLDSGPHRGGLTYEIKVYEQIFPTLNLSHVKYYGSCFISSSNEIVMILEYLEDSERLSESLHPETFLPLAAEWIGRLHSRKEFTHPNFLTRYTEEYYTRWIDNLKPFVHRLKSDYSWVVKLANYFVDNLDFLLSAEQCLIHGEYYPGNILLSDSEVFPIDWESAAVGPGEIDLASLIAGWEEEFAHHIVETYKETRWGDLRNVPTTFDQRFKMSQLYFEFRWFSEFFEGWFKKPKEFEPMRKLAHDFGVL